MSALAVIRPDPDLLYGAAAISAHLKMTAKQVYHLHDQGHLPTFKIGGKVCARRSEMEAHFARASAAQRGGGDPSPAPSATSTAAAILYGHRAIAAHLGMPAADVERLDLARRLPTYQDDGCTVASTAALDHWQTMKGGRA